MSNFRQNGKNSKVEKHDVLQAVILTQDFNNNLSPMSDLLCSMLTPVANTCLFDYLMESLIHSEIQEVFVFCSNYVDVLKSHISMKKYVNISISLIISDGCRSFGDALRDIDTKGCIRDDFILIRADAFVNVNLTSFMNKHKIRRAKDKGCVLTVMLRDIGSAEKSMLHNDTCLLVTDKLSNKILFYKKSVQGDRKVDFDINWFLNHETIGINDGYIDSHVYLCSPALLPLFSDNFDFQTMEDFIKGVLINEEILNSRIYWQCLNYDEYALPITSWAAYHTLNRDILERQSYPLTPDTLYPFNNIVFTSRSIYKHHCATLAKGCLLQKNTIIDNNSVIGKNTSISRSVVHKDCIIGDNVFIENSYIWNNVVIHNNCTIKNSILFYDSIINSNVELDTCIIMPHVNIPSEMHYTCDIIEENSGELIPKNLNKLSNNSDQMSSFKQAVLNNANSYDYMSDSYSSESEFSSDENSRVASPVPDDMHMFLSEVIDSLLRGYQDKLNCENLILEINSSRYAYNVGIREVTYNVVKAILLLPLHYLTETKSIINDVNYQKTLKTMISYFHSILLNYIKSNDAQLDCLKAIEEVSESSLQLLNFSQRLLHLFYQKDVLSEENILNWYYNRTVNDDEIYNKVLRKTIQPFIKWLVEAEEDSSSEGEIK